MEPWKFREVEIAFIQRENRRLYEEKVGFEYTEVMGKEIVCDWNRLDNDTEQSD